MKTRKNDERQLFTWTYTNQITSWLVHSLSVFGARTSHGQTWTHKIHHSSDLKEATPPSPLYYTLCLATLCLATGPAPKCHFVSGLPSESLEIPKIGAPTILQSHNFLCRPSIEMRSEAKL
jgi:hypothetical protein